MTRLLLLLRLLLPTADRRRPEPQNTFNYPHSPVFTPLIERIIGKGLVWVEDQSGNPFPRLPPMHFPHALLPLRPHLEHRRMRSIVAPAFTHENVRNMNDDIWTIAATLQAKLNSHIRNCTPEEANDRGFVLVDLTHWSAIAALDVIGRCGFNHDFQCGESAESKSILHHWRTQVSAGMDTSAFIGLVILRAFPFITSLPIPAIQAQGEIKTTVRKLAGRIMRSDGDLQRNSDVLSLLRGYPFSRFLP